MHNSNLYSKETNIFMGKSNIEQKTYFERFRHCKKISRLACAGSARQSGRIACFYSDLSAATGSLRAAMREGIVPAMSVSSILIATKITA